MRSQGKYTGDTTAGELPGALKKVLYADIQDLAAVFCARDSKNIFLLCQYYYSSTVQVAFQAKYTGNRAKSA